MLSVFLRRFPRCYHSNHLIGADVHRLSTRDFSGSAISSNKPKRKSTMAVAQKQVMHLANSAKEAAASIVARLPEKEIKLVIRSFECAANRPNRVTRLITRNNIDVFWMNAWFSSLNDDPACPLYPFPVSMPNGFNEAKKIMFDSIMKANKFKNSDFFANITRRRFTSETLKVKDGSNSEILKYLDEVLRKIPVATSIQLSQAINEFSAEKVTVVSLKRSMRKISGIHAHALPSLFHLLDLPFNSPALIEEGNSVLEGYESTLTKSIMACNAVTMSRRTRHVNKMARKKIIEDIDPLTEAYLVSGSNPSTKDLLSDLQVDTELSVMMRGQIPARTVELRRRSLKSEHCLQITLECRIQDSREGHYQSVHQSFGAQGGLDAAGGYDDFSTPAQELDVKVDNETDLTTEDEWHNSPYKIFIDNIAPDVADSDLIHALRHGGAAKSVRFMKSSQGSILSAPLSRDSVPLTADALYEKFGIRTDARPRICGNGELRNVLLPKNPLAVITAVKRRAIKKTIAQVQRNDSCAFALMSNEESFLKMTERDDVRIFGICVGGQTCRVKSSRKLNTIFLETRACISALNVKSFLNLTLGNDHVFEVTDSWGNNGGRVGDPTRYHDRPAASVDHVFLTQKVMPVFVVLRFQDHRHAWNAHVKLAAAIERGAPFKQSWTRTSWYYNVKAKAREMQMINQILLEDIEHSEGRMDGLTTADYIASIEDDEDEDADEPFVRTVRRPFVPSPPAPVLEEVVKEEVEEVIVKRKRRSSKEIKELKEKKIAEKALKKSLKCLPKSGKKNKTFTFPVLHEPVHIRQHFYDSDGDLMTANADKLRGY